MGIKHRLVLLQELIYVLLGYCVSVYTPHVGPRLKIPSSSTDGALLL